MKGAAAVAEILKREGVEFLIGYPVNPIIEAAAEADIRTIIVRQERTGLHMADAVSRLSSGQRIGVFAMQHGPGVRERLRRRGPGLRRVGADRRPAGRLSRAGSPTSRRTSTRSSTTATSPSGASRSRCADAIPDAMRRAFTQVRERPAPARCWSRSRPTSSTEEVPEPLTYRPTFADPLGPGPAGGRRGGAGSWWRPSARSSTPGRASTTPGPGSPSASWPNCWRPRSPRASRGRAPSPRTTRCRSGPAAARCPRPVHHFLQNADVIFGIGCSFATTNFGVPMPKGKVIVHATLDPADLNKDVPAEHALIGDAGAHAGGADRRGPGSAARAAPGRAAGVAPGRSRAVKAEWLAEWMPKLTSDEVPALALPGDLGPAAHGGRRPNTIITHDAGSPRDQLSPFWERGGPAHLHRLGQDHAARLRARPGDGGQAGRSRRSSASTSGAMRPSASPAWTSRPRCASASPSCRSCSTTSRWPSSCRS